MSSSEIQEKTEIKEKKLTNSKKNLPLRKE